MAILGNHDREENFKNYDGSLGLDRVAKIGLLFKRMIGFLSQGTNHGKPELAELEVEQKRAHGQVAKPKLKRIPLPNPSSTKKPSDGSYYEVRVSRTITPSLGVSQASFRNPKPPIDCYFLNSGSRSGTVCELSEHFLGNLTLKIKATSKVRNNGQKPHSQQHRFPKPKPTREFLIIVM